ncbi:MAG: 6-pyruvoyl-tetrahydropterin synthase-related protein, partial [Anaerolineales bacterium]|nr:6-pyruvoyl-tetrahydropterin synthase-related protein [Anaerolineales bacterium]
MASDRQLTTSGGSEQRSPLVALYASRFAPRLPLLLALAFAILAALPLFGNAGFLNTRGIGDSPNLLFRVHQLITALAGGEFPARWMPDAAYGYGMPYFTYYASFSTHVAALLKVYGFSYVNAIKLTQLLALLVAAGGMYGWLRAAQLTPAQAMLGSAAYTLTPFHLVNLYIRGDSLAELWAMALYPLVLWAALLCLCAPAFRRTFALAFAVAVLVCTHNISSLNFLPFVGLYLLSNQQSTISNQQSVTNSQRPVISHQSFAIGILSILWGLALAAFFWLPALGETAFVQLDDLTRGFFFYGNHFRSTDLVQTTLWFDYDGNPFSMGLLQTA